ncbi:MAG TPA: hypothetical protein VFC60_00180 [Tissierellaceae bacterium]|nr:hypothetical protein [Tissierellaceae bacterium]
MNKSILKHEFKSSRWILLFSTIISLFTIVIFNIRLNERYERLFRIGLRPNQAVIQDALGETIALALLLFTILSIIQVFMQFRSEKDQEVGRFLKSLPLAGKEFFKVKLITGIANITIGFIVLFIGLIAVRQANIFWIKDIYSISAYSHIFMKLDGIGTILSYLGLTYFVVLAFYTFIFMIQYTFTNIVGAIVTGILVWLSPFFIALSLIETISKLGRITLYDSSILNNINTFSDKLLPWSYVVDYDFYNIGNVLYPENLGSISFISNMGLKYGITITLVIVNIFIGYKFVKNSRIEDEEKIITFKISRQIFKIGVTICTPLLVSIIITVIMGIDLNNILFIIILLLSSYLGYFISNKITKVGSR